LVEEFGLPRFTLGKGILATVAGWLIGLALLALVKRLTVDPLASALAYGIAFTGWFIGYWWLSNYWSWKAALDKEEWMPTSFRRHVIVSSVAGAGVMGMNILLDRIF
jgi:hypothetical protein